MNGDRYMERKVLHMIGNSHIDPVWFWTREEGMQEVKATFASAIQRMEEFPDFCFTCTSAAFFQFLEEAEPALLEKIRERVKEGRFEITGGWWVEPDCNLPCGEAFVRQGLYGQRYFLKTFGKMAGIGSNVDSFGHNPMLPQILLKCGLDKYLFMRPSLTRSEHKYMKDPVPLVSWRSPDGSRVTALSLPAEYTCWFLEPARENIEATLAQLDRYPALPCFYGVGNHGGGPTIANIEAIRTLQPEYPHVELRFSTLGAFFDQVQGCQAETLTAYLEKVNGGCYSIDHLYKQHVRRAEQALLRAERLLSMASLAGDGFHFRFAALEPLWRRLLFCQFHDTMGGTCIRAARDNALADVGGVTAQAEEISQIAVQRLAGRLDTRGEGMPILLINDSPHPWRGIIDTELNWFCNDPLTLRDEGGREIVYQRDKQACTMMWYRLGGRRRVLFHCDLPPFGVRLVRACAQVPSFASAPSHEGGELRLENSHIIALWNEQGDLCSLMDRATGYQAFSGDMAFRVWADERDSWGHGTPERAYGQLPEEARTEEAALVERGPLRQVIRVRKRLSVCRLELLYTLDGGEDHLRISVRLVWDGPWKQLKLHLPLACGAQSTLSESPYGTMLRSEMGEEFYMHRFVDAHDGEGRGLTVANDGVYGFSMEAGQLRLSLLRSAIFAQGNCVGWQNGHDTYEYTDLGEHAFTFLMSPHGSPRPVCEMAALADRLSGPPLCLVDTFHPGALPADVPHSFLRIAAENVRLGALKKWEDGDGLILRLNETEGEPTRTTLFIAGQAFEVSLGAHEIKTLLFASGTVAPVNMLEMKAHADK